MLRQQATLFNKLTKFIDLTLLVGGFLLAYQWLCWADRPLGPLRNYLWVLLFAIPIWFWLLFKNSLYTSIRRYSYFDITTRLINVNLAGAVLLFALVYMIDKESFSRLLLVTFVFCTFFLLYLEKTLLRYTLGYLRKKGYNTRHLLIVGTQDKAQNFCRLIEDHQDWGLRIQGFLQVAKGPLKENVAGYRVLGYAEKMIDVCKTHRVDEVVFCLPKDLFLDAEEYLKDLEELGVTVRMVLDFFDVYQSHRELNFFHDNIPILTFHTKEFDLQQLFMKRCLDVCGALVGLLITILLLPFIAFALKKDSEGPLFFGQERIGENGRLFRCWKFRSMYIDAEERKKELMSQNEMKGAIFKIKDDPRITPFGKFLRKTSLDELPQFWNVFKGEMSLVGTRPPTPEEVEKYENWQRRRISIKPGITGLWQVSGRNEIDDFDEIVRLDLRYIDEWSIWLDIKLLLKTIKVVFMRKGSC